MFVRPKIAEIQNRRETLGYSQHQLSLKAELSGCAVCRIESGATQRVHQLRAKALADALNCKLEDIFSFPEKDAG